MRGPEREPDYPNTEFVSQKREWRERRPRGGMQVAARIGERLRREMARGRRPSPKGGRWLATPNTPSFPRNPCVCGGGGVPSSPRRRADRSVSSSKTFYLEQAGRRAPTRPSAPGSGRACTVGTKRSPNQVSSLLALSRSWGGGHTHTPSHCERERDLNS